MSEMDIKADIRLAVTRYAPRTRLFNNPVGEGWVGKVVQKDGALLTLVRARHVTFGLFPGSSDLIGWTSVTITPEMVGKTVAVFTAPEVKFGRNGAQTNQTTWIDNVRAAGGLADAVRSPEDVLRLVGAK